MKRVAFILLIAHAVLPLSAQEQYQPVFSSVFGPRLGVTWIIADPAAFNDAVQLIKPAPGRTYFPVITQFGVNIEQHIRLGSTNSNLLFQEVILIGGVDQNLLLPSASLLIGFRAGFGLEAGIGPFFYITALPTGDIDFITTVVIAVGYTISFSNINIPVDIAFVPVPADGRPRLSLLTGFNFAIGKRQ